MIKNKKKIIHIIYMSSYSNIGIFIVTLVLYYYKIKPSLTLDIINNQDLFKKYTSSGYTSLFIFLLIVVISQWLLNVSNISSKCGGSVNENIGPAGLMTFFPWLLIFGVLIIVLTLYPGFKTAFSDVVGYFFISSSANKLLTELLIDKDIQEKLNVDGNITPQQKSAMQDAADAIIKICGNTSILINQMVPLNFDKYWGILTPLMKQKYQNGNSPETTDIKNKIFDLVVTRDNVGEAMWFLYTGFLITSLVQLNISNRGCISNPATMAKNYQNFLAAEDKAEQKRKEATNQVYTVT